MGHRLKVVTEPAFEPITLDEFKRHVGIYIDDENADNQRRIRAGRQLAETITNRILCDSVWELRLDAFPENNGRIMGIKSPLIAVNSIKYVDTSGVLQTLSASAYQVDTFSEPPRVVPAYGYQWPATRDELNAVRIEFQAGYATAGEIPDTIIALVSSVAATLEKFREIVITGTIRTEIDTIINRLGFHDTVFEAGE